MDDINKLEQFIAKAKELTPDEKTNLYNLFVRYYDQGDYLNASKLIEALLIIEPNNSTYLKSAASCYQQQKQYTNAYAFYNYSFIVSGNNDCLLYMSNCLIEVAEYELAKVYLEKFFADNDAQNSSNLVARAKMLLKYVENKLGNFSE